MVEFRGLMDAFTSIEWGPEHAAAGSSSSSPVAPVLAIKDAASPTLASPQPPNIASGPSIDDLLQRSAGPDF
eukprot:5119893-Alexandrium_andersonii.AAC.1